MASWQNIESGIAGDQRYFNWEVPNIQSGTTFVRVRRGNQNSVSSDSFNIFQLPTYEIKYHSPTQAKISWEPVTGASHYDIFGLGEEYMEITHSTTDTFFLLNCSYWSTRWLSVRARKKNKIIGRRAEAQKYTHRPCDTQISIDINFDLYPSETRWEILDALGGVVTTGGPYEDQVNGSSLSIQECLPFGCYTFVVYDAYSDGICCSYGDGHYEVRDASGNMLATGGSFGYSESTEFCISQNADAISLKLIALANVSCHGGNDGWIYITGEGGSGNYNYSWSHGASGQFASQLSAGSYQITVSDGNQFLVSSFLISQPEAISLAVETETANCSDPNGAMATALASGGLPPYHFSWSNGNEGETLEGIAPGNYAVVVSDAENCSHSISFTIENPPEFSVSISGTDASCFGLANGSAMASLISNNNGYTLLWNTGATSSGLQNLPAGNYQLTATNDLGCMAVASINIQEPEPVSVLLQSVPLNCSGDNNGQISALVTGGSPPYAYIWNTGHNGNTIQQLTSGQYNLTVTDAGGCDISIGHFLTQPNPILLDIQKSGQLEEGTLSLFGSISGGTPPYTYQWNNGSQNPTISILSAGTYSLTVSDAYSCYATQLIQVEAPSDSYCEARGSNTNYEWIEQVNFGAIIDNHSGNNGGYAIFEDENWVLVKGQEYEVNLHPGFSLNAFNESWRIWIDLNGDFDFEDNGEEVFSPPVSNSTQSGVIEIPYTATNGPTRMRIAMKYGSPAPYCGIFAYGEVEDYLIQITEPVNNKNISNQAELAEIPVRQSRLGFDGFQIYPNPARDQIRLVYQSESISGAEIKVMSLLGQELLFHKTNLHVGKNTLSLETHTVPPGNYLLLLIHDQKVLSQQFTIVP